MIGKDFSGKEQSKIYFKTKTLTLKSLSSPIPSHSGISQDNRESQSTILLNSRCETLIEIIVNNPVIEEGIIPDTDIEYGIHLSKCITKVRANNKVYTLLY